MASSFVVSLFFILNFGFSTMVLPSAASDSSSPSSSLSDCLQSFPHLREYFYVGGKYVTTATGESQMKNQMYVEKLSPINVTHHSAGRDCQAKPVYPPYPPYPIVLIHGKGMTGTNWLNTPDGRPGWASFFLAQGYTVYIVDQPTRARSPWLPGDVPLTTFTAEYISYRFTGIQYYGLWPQAKLHTQWPGSGLKGDPTFDAFVSSTVQFLSNDTEAELRTKHAGVSLLDRIGPAILLTHSQGGHYGWTIADARPSLVKAIIAMEPSGPPFRDAVFDTSPARPWGMTDIAITYDPPVSDPGQLKLVTIPSNRTDRASCVLQQEPGARQLPNLRVIPVLVEVSQSSYHAFYDHCVLEYFQQAGLERVELLRLEEIGIYGNGHMQMMEKNNLQIAQALHEWAGKALGY